MATDLECLSGRCPRLYNSTRSPPHLASTLSVEAQVLRIVRRVFMVAALLFTTASATGAQTACDHLVPFGVLPPAGGFTFGCTHQYTLKLGASIGLAGNYILLAYPECADGPCAGQSGTTLLQCAAASGYFCCLSVSQMIPTIVGTNVGTLVAGLNQRIANDTDTRGGICYSAYTGNGSRVGKVPLIQFIGADRSQAQVTGFLSLFLVGPPTGTSTSTAIRVEFIADVTPTRGATWGRLKALYR